MNAPCKDCPDRHPGCHSTCKAYIQFDRENAKLREQRIKHIADNDNSPNRKQRERNYKLWELRGGKH